MSQPRSRGRKFPTCTPRFPVSWRRAPCDRADSGIVGGQERQAARSVRHQMHTAEENPPTRSLHQSKEVGRPGLLPFLRTVPYSPKSCLPVQDLQTREWAIMGRIGISRRRRSFFKNAPLQAPENAHSLLCRTIMDVCGSSLNVTVSSIEAQLSSVCLDCQAFLSAVLTAAYHCLTRGHVLLRGAQRT